jgi:hypothetical protein
LKYSGGRNRIARMADSPCHAEREVLFTISDAGVSDVKDWRKAEQPFKAPE